MNDAKSPPQEKHVEEWIFLCGACHIRLENCTCSCSVCNKKRAGGSSYPRLSEGKLVCFKCVKCSRCKQHGSEVSGWIWLEGEDFECGNCFRGF